MFFLLFLIFTVIPLAELYVIIKTAQVIGTWETVGLLFLSGVLGAYFVKSQSRGLILRINGALVEGRIPADDLVAAFAIFAGGVLMIAPGFITDILGLLLVLPPTRMVIVLVLKKYFAHLVKQGSANFQFRYYQSNSTHQEPNSTPARDVFDVKPEYLEGDPRKNSGDNQ